MSGYSSGFPPNFFEAALQHAHTRVGYHPADMWVRFTEAKLAVLQARSVSKDRTEQLQALMAASSSLQASVRKTEEAITKMQAKIVEAERVWRDAQATTLDSEREFGDMLEEIQSDPSFYCGPPFQHSRGCLLAPP
eukprot:2772741-Rhodomonas_salina.1